MSAATWVVGILLLGILALAVRSLIKARRSGCGGGCAGCSSQSCCPGSNKNK